MFDVASCVCSRVWSFSHVYFECRKTDFWLNVISRGIGDGVIGVASIGEPSVEYSETTSSVLLFSFSHGGWTGVVVGSDCSLVEFKCLVSWQQVSVSRPGLGENPTCLIV